MRILALIFLSSLLTFSCDQDKNSFEMVSLGYGPINPKIIEIYSNGQVYYASEEPLLEDISNQLRADGFFSSYYLGSLNNDQLSDFYKDFNDALMSSRSNLNEPVMIGQPWYCITAKTHSQDSETHQLVNLPIELKSNIDALFLYAESSNPHLVDKERDFDKLDCLSLDVSSVISEEPEDI